MVLLQRTAVLPATFGADEDEIGLLVKFGFMDAILVVGMSRMSEKHAGYCLFVLLGMKSKRLKSRLQEVKI